MADIVSRLPTQDQADGATGSAAPVEALLVGGTDGTSLRALSTTSTGILNTAAPIQTTSGTLTGLASVVTLNLLSTGAINIDVSGSGFVGTITVVENTPSSARQLGLFALNSSAIQSTITTNGTYRVVGVPVAPSISVQFSSYTSGSATITIYASQATYIVQPYSSNASNVLVTSYLNDGSGNALTSTSGALNVSSTTANDTVTTGTITAQDTSSTSTTYFNNQVWYSGTPTAGSSFQVSTLGIETGMVEVTGTWTGTLQTEVSVDGGTNWIAHSIHQIGSSAFISSFTNNLAGSLNMAAKTMFRVRSTATWTGTANIRLISSQNPSTVYIANSLKLVDVSSPTSSTVMNIAPASTAAVSTQTGLVVALSPNTPLNGITGTVSLPTGAATSANQTTEIANQTNGTQKTQIVDGSGNVIASQSNQLETVDILNVSSQYRAQSVTTTAAEALGGATILTNRKMLTITPTNGTIYWGYNSSVTTATGTPLSAFQTLFLSVGSSNHVYVIAAATTDSRIGELS